MECKKAPARKRTDAVIYFQKWSESSARAQVRIMPVTITWTIRLAKAQTARTTPIKTVTTSSPIMFSITDILHLFIFGKNLADAGVEKFHWCSFRYQSEHFGKIKVL